MQNICNVGPAGPGGDVRITPANPSMRGVNPAVLGGYATAGSEVEPAGPMNPLTP